MFALQAVNGGLTRRVFGLGVRPVAALGWFVSAVAALAGAAPGVAVRPAVETYRFGYRTHDGKWSYAVLLPAWYGPRRNPPIPLAICPHGRNTTPEAAARRWSNLPTRGGFAVVLPAGQGRVLQLDSWGYAGQIADLARMPVLARRAV
jgi:poly(3-hydroxybutyrate) depolymerase